MYHLFPSKNGLLLHRRVMKISLFLTVYFIVFNFTSFTQNIPQRLDSFFNSLYAYKEINGNVLIAENGNIIYKKSFGFSNFENQTPNTDSTGFTLASVSKVFTSTAILQLKDKGKLKLDDPVVKYFSDFPYPDITIRNLLSHTSGLPDYEIYEDQIAKSPNKLFSNTDVLPSLKMWKEPLSAKPGEKWQYSNTNFCLLALLVEKLSGLTFQNYLQKNIFASAKMYDTFFQTDSLHAKNKYKARNYEYPFLYSFSFKDVDSLKQYRWILINASGFVGQGNIITTNGDLLKFDKALYLGKILKPSTLLEAFTPMKLKNGENANADIGIGKASYGLGWFIFNDTTEGKIVWHTGGRPGALGIFIRNITKKQTVIMFDNAFHKSLYANGVNAMAILNNKQVNFKKVSLTRDYGSALVNKGIDIAFCRLQELQTDSAHYYLNEDDNNELGLRLLYEASFNGHNELALEVLKLNTLLFPKSFNTYDSYGEALSKTGKKEEAILMYKKSVEINPENEGGKKALEELMKK
jgi:CubicO group peptidase (beta-lactamase class C family)